MRRSCGAGGGSSTSQISQSTEAREPYVGPRPFELGDRAIYFGRGGEVNQLAALVVSNPAVLLYAASGVGKTSLINAGLMPRLEERGFEVFAPARLRPSGEDPTLSSAANVFAFSMISSWAGVTARPLASQIMVPVAPNQSSAPNAPSAPNTPSTSTAGGPQRDPALASSRLAQITIAEYLAERTHPVDEDGFAKPRIVLLDQFEELFTLFPEHWNQRESYFEQLRDALKKDGLLRVVISMREEFVAQLDRYSSILPGGLRTRFRLEALDRVAALDAVRQPLGHTHRSFATGVAEELVDDLLQYKVDTVQGGIISVPGEFVDPVQLQVVCRTLWLNLPTELSEITQEHVRQYGSVDQALSKFYDDAVMAAAEKNEIEEARIRRWFEDAFITTVGTRNMVYETPLETAGMPNGVIAEFDSRHLVRSERRAAARWWELTHDRLIEPVRSSNRRFELQLTDEKTKFSPIDANRALASAAQALETARYSDALNAVSRALATYRGLGDRAGEAAALSQAADVQLALGQVALAEAAAREAESIYVQLADQTGEAAIHMKLAEIFSFDGDFRGANRHYEWAATIFKKLRDPGGEADASWGLGMAQRKQGLSREAIGSFEAAILKYREAGDQARAADATVQAGTILYEQADYPTAEAHFLAAHESYLMVFGPSHPTTLGAQNFLAFTQWAQGNTSTAAMLMEFVLRGQSETLGLENLETVDTMLNVASLRLTLGDAEASIRLLEQALKSSRNLHETEREVTALVGLAAAYQTRGDLESALKHGKEAVRLNPSDWRGYYACAMAHWYEGRFQEAATAFTSVLQLQSEDLGSLLGRGQCLAELGQFDQAIADLDRIIITNNDDAVRSYARRGRAVAYAGLGRIDEALTELDLCVKTMPDNAWAFMSRAEVLLKAGRIAEAVSDLNQALERKGPPLTPYLRQKAMGYLKKYGSGSPVPA